ncbi:MAG: penicillin acylase family protein [Caldilineales bacterium]|nr:penicillin acylase family protein [Caldilineales bacterium]MCW5856902.1 penicillin acylase family protein [Caldilineales bacterium]
MSTNTKQPLPRRRLGLAGRILFVVLGILLIAVLALVGFGVYQARLAWPQTKGALQLPGLQDTVTVIRDKRGVPHIYASNSHDLFMAQGFVHAQDRFWQMEFWRRIGQGRLSELFGESSLSQDRFLRTMGVQRSAELSWQQLDAETRAALEAYAEGVNVYIEQNKGRLPLEFRLLGLTGVQFTPEPWTPINTLTWATMMAYNLGGNYDNELDRAQMMARYGEDWMRELTAYPYPADRPLILPEGVAWEKVDTNLLAGLPPSLLLGQGEGIGSNNWVVGGSRTETGMPLLANDPHLSIQMPSIWYENGLHCQPKSAACAFDVVGFSFPTSPGVVIGHNDRIAWGATNAYPDVQDLYIEKVNPANPDQYEVNGQWVEMEVSQEEIKVAGRDQPEILTVRRTRHGPIMNDVAYGTQSRWAYGWQPLALRWTALEGSRIPSAVLGINLAQNWEQFRAALAQWDAPSQNFVYADVDGNIGYQMPGQIPFRPHDGLVPVPGWTDDYEWQGFVPFDQLPSSYNPDQGYIVTANNLVAPYEQYPWLTRHEGSQGFRAQRIVDMIEAKDKIGVADFMAIHGDDANVFAGDVIPRLAEVKLDRSEVAAARDRLLSWDLQETMDSPEAAFFEAFWYYLPTEMFADELSEMAPRDRELVRQIMQDPDSHWWDDLRTPDRETQDQILARTLDKAYDLVVERLGSNPSQWRWGALHTATFRNQTLGESGIGLIEGIFNRGPFETAGGGEIVNATGWSTADEDLFQLTSLPSLRVIIDLADFSRSVATNTTGQSGHPYHKHYDDQIDQWRRIEYAPIYWLRDQVEAHSEGTLTLMP